jgi:hypothetical protein
MERDELDEDLETIEESRAEGDEDDQEDEYSEESDDSDDVVDASVQEDMLRFQETFKGIKDRFRLINRIGEGKQGSFAGRTLIDAIQVHSLPYTRRKISYTKHTTTIGTSKRKKTPPNGHHHP